MGPDSGRATHIRTTGLALAEAGRRAGGSTDWAGGLARVLGVGAFDRLIDDAATMSPANPSADDVVAGHRLLRASTAGNLIGPLVVPEQNLAQVGRACGHGSLEVAVVISGGAGGLLAVARRDVAGVHVVAVESALRDLDDLAGNAARVAAAAQDLGDEVGVFVQIPYAHGWIGAVEEIEAAGLLGAIGVGGADAADRPSAEQLAEQLSGLVEADLPFKLTGSLRRGWPTAAGHGYLTVMLALEALIDGAEVSDAAELLRLDDQEGIKTAFSTWDDATAARVRRRLRSIDCDDARAAVADLAALDLVAYSS